MNTTEILDSLTQEYFKKAQNVIEHSSLFAGAFGLGGGIKNNPCHTDYYDKIEETLKDDEINPYDAVKFLLTAEKSYECPQTVSFMLKAIQGLALDLVPKLTDEQKKEFRTYFDENIPKRERFPNQKAVYDALGN